MGPVSGGIVQNSSSFVQTVTDHYMLEAQLQLLPLSFFSAC